MTEGQQGQQQPEDERLRITEIRNRMQAAHLPTDDDIAAYEKVGRFFGDQGITDQEFLGYLRVLDRLYLREGGVAAIRLCFPWGSAMDG